jgi:Flp pilus assembly protein TadD
MLSVELRIAIKDLIVQYFVKFSQKYFSRGELAMKRHLVGVAGPAVLAVGIAMLGVQMLAAQDDTVARLSAETAAHPDQLDLRMQLGNAAAAAGDLDLALASFQKVLDHLEPESRGAGDLHLRIGETWRRKGDLAAAVESLTHAAQLLPDKPVVLGTLALVLDGIGRKADAARAYQATIDLDPENAIAMNNLAFLLAEQNGDLDHAWRLAQRAIDLSDDDAEVIDTAGWVQWKRKQIDSAVGLFAQALSKDADNAEVRKHLLMALGARQDAVAGEARAMLEGANGDSGKTREALRALTAR